MALSLKRDISRSMTHYKSRQDNIKLSAVIFLFVTQSYINEEIGNFLILIISKSIFAEFLMHIKLNEKYYLIHQKKVE